MLAHLAQRALSYLCSDLSRKVLATPLRQLEQVGIARILSTLTDDVVTIGWAIANVPAVAMNAAVLGGCAVYLGWLSWRILLVVALPAARRYCLPRADLSRVPAPATRA